MAKRAAKSTRGKVRRQRTSPARTKAKRGSEESEAEFLASYDASAFDQVSVAVDVAVISAKHGALLALVVERDEHPELGKWALPGGFVKPDESLDSAAARILAAKAGLHKVFLEQLYTFGDPGRDPRTRVIAVAYVALADVGRFSAELATGRKTSFGRIEVPWQGETGGPVDLMAPDGTAMAVAFDHADILGMAVKRIRGKLDYTPIGFQLLPESFTLLELREVHETVLGRPLNKDSFRRRMLASGQLEATGERQRASRHRPAELYRFRRRSAV